MSDIRIGYIPVGVKFSPASDGSYPAAEEYHGVSYCDAVRQASDGAGKPLLITPGSIEVCRWSPVVLGLREPDKQFDMKIEYAAAFPTGSVLVAPINAFKSDAPPDVVLIRAERDQLKKLIVSLPPQDIAFDLAGKLDRSALEVFRSGGNPFDKMKVQTVNETLAALNQLEPWRDFTKWIFNRDWTTYLFDLLLDRFLANMSICRNSTAIPLKTGKVNVSYFCTGGIAWGMNKPNHLTCGFPYRLYEKFDLAWDS